MTKFFSSIVFIFGILLLVVVSFTILQRYAPWENRPVNDAALVPSCDLLPLDLGTQDEFHQTLDNLYAKGGMTMVQTWVEGEVVPGRTLLIAGNRSTDPVTRLAVIDRELRQSNHEGVALLDRPAMVPRQATKLRLGSRSVLVNWTRQTVETPFTLTAWCLPEEK